MIDIVFSDSFATTLRQYYQQKQMMHDVLSLPLYLSLGDISQRTFLESRKTVYKIQYAHTNESEALTSQSVHKIKKAMHNLDLALERDEPLRIWWSDKADDYCGFLWLCDYLVDFDVVTTSVHVPMVFSTLGDELLTITGLGDLSESGIDKLQLFSFESALPKTERDAYHYYWAQLRGENNPVRTIINGLAISQSIDFYDRFIFANLSQRRFRDIIRVIGETVGNYPFGPTWWYRHRIDYLVSKGTIDFKPSEPTFDESSDGKIKLNMSNR